MNAADDLTLRTNEKDKHTEKKNSESRVAEKEDKTEKGIVYATVEQPGKVNFSSN